MEKRIEISASVIVCSESLVLVYCMYYSTDPGEDFIPRYMKVFLHKYCITRAGQNSSICLCKKARLKSLQPY